MIQKRFFLILLIGLLAVNYSCQGYQKTLKSANNQLKFDTGVDLYEKGDYTKALQFFDVLRAVYRGTEKGELLTYYSANSYFHIKDYNVAAYYYKQYAQTYPRGDKAQECAFMSAYCNYMQSPRYSLDQTNTFVALGELQSFIDLYPKSEKVAESNKLMDDLRAKLEKKAYNISVLYYRMEDFQAAITSFKNILDEYPDTNYKEEILYYTVKAYYTYAENSIPSMKKDRYEKTVEAYNNLLYLYPDSKYLKDVKKINEEARTHIKN